MVEIVGRMIGGVVVGGILVVALASVALAAGTESVGVVDTGQGQWHLRHADGHTTRFFFGNPGDTPLVGDWDCDGVDTPGLFRSTDGFVYLRNSNSQGVADVRFFFGNPFDVPIAGDWDGDGCDTVSLYRPMTQQFFIVNELGSEDGGLGAADFSFVFGNPNDQPVAGDWDADGSDEVGLQRISAGLFYWRNSLTTGIADGSIIFGNPGDEFVAGDWGPQDGRDTPAVYRPGDATFYFRHTLTQGIAESQQQYGVGYMLPVAGDFGLPDEPFAGRRWVTQTMDTDAGRFASMAFGRDGKPLIAYGAKVAGSAIEHLGFARCLDWDCLSRGLANTGERVNDHTSVAVAPAGPVATYHDFPDQLLKLVRCLDPGCVRSEHVAIAARGVLSALTVLPDGRPIAAYLDSSPVDLNAVTCELLNLDRLNRTCPAPEVNLLDFGGANFEVMDVTIGSDGLPVVSYMRQSDDNEASTEDLFVYHCADPTCRAGRKSLVTTMLPALGGTGFTSIAVGADGLPIVAAGGAPGTPGSSSGNGLVTAACADLACTAATVVRNGPAGSPVSFVSVDIGPDGLPLVAYRNDVAQRLELLRCLTPRCDGATETFVVDGTGDTGLFASLGVDPFGTPWIAYYDRGGDRLRLAHLVP